MTPEPYSEADTRQHLIDASLRLAGWLGDGQFRRACAAGLGRWAVPGGRLEEPEVHGREALPAVAADPVVDLAAGGGDELSVRRRGDGLLDRSRRARGTAAGDPAGLVGGDAGVAAGDALDAAPLGLGCPSGDSKGQRHRQHSSEMHGCGRIWSASRSRPCGVAITIWSSMTQCAGRFSSSAS